MVKELSSPFNWDSTNDLSDVFDNEDVILEYLKGRFEHGQIYTWVGPLLLAINPGCANAVDHYSRTEYEKHAKSSNVTQKDVEPHVFALAARARYRLAHNLGKACQVIVISGDSGAGKTFTARMALDFLATTNQNHPVHPDKVFDMLRKISSAYPVIAAFSTASTERNAYSSRHGQLIQLQYVGGIIQGASIHSFLLERSRVTKGGNNYHIFYQLLAGLPDPELKMLGLSREAKYRIIGTGFEGLRERVIKDFKEVLMAMNDLGFTDSCRDDIFKVIALVIHLGNVQFKDDTRGACVIDTSDEDSREALQNICNLTLLPGEDIVELLTTSLISPRSLWRRHTTYRRNLQNVETCRSRLHGIVRYLYSRLFHWLVNRINEMLTVQTDHGSWLGILDIFGFESFDVNGIEQLCVNYSNERLQLYFMEEYLERSRRDLEEEGLTDLPPSQSMNNYQERLSIIEGRLFTALNDACLSPVAVDLSVLNSRLFSYQDGTRKFISSKGQVFVIKHYSCPVEYSIPDLLSKNIDKVPSDELLSTFGLSGNDFLRRLINTDEEISQDRNIYAKRRTTLARLKHNLDVLIKELSKCDSHYVRCVRPGDADRWVKAEFSKQLAHTGVLDALPLTRCKFPIRLRYEEFCKRYSKHLTDMSHHDSKEQSKKIMKQMVGQEGQQFSVHFGNRLIFLTENIFHTLEIDRQKYRDQCVARIQHFWAKYKSRTTSNESNRKSITQCEEKTLVEIPKMSDIARKPSQNSSDDDVFLSEDVESSPYYFVDIEGKVTTMAPITSAPAIATSTSQSKNERSERSNGSKVASDDDPTNRYLESCNHFSCNSFTLDEMHRTSSPDCACREFEWTNKLQMDSNENVIPSLVVEDDTIRESTKIPGEKYNESGYAANGSSYSKFSAKQCHSREEYVAQWLYNVSPMPNGSETKEIDSTDVTPERSRNSLRSNASDLSVEAKTTQETSAIDKCIPCAAANAIGKEMSAACNKQKSFTKRQPTVTFSSWDRTSNVVRIDNCVFFYKNRILSRRRISEVPVRFHTRLTCLADSHRLPRSELPNGLQDCL